MHENTTARVEAFSDGVFGIALTLLVLDFKVPHLGDQSAITSRQLTRELLHMWPTIIAFVLSFGTVLTMWINHHGLFRHAHRTDNRLLFANGLLLLVVTFVPFPTAVLADYLDRPAANAATAFYCGTFILINIGYNLLLRAIEVNRHPTPTPSEDAAFNGIRRTYYITFGVYLLATIMALWNAYVGLAICLSLWLVWALLKYEAGHRSLNPNDEVRIPE
ncbi:MAG TPA: TMEM175 family protein [Tepidisphaeraceae bacterium]|nr:TMEM175 family protein [Tepidisphaeraceae bacterium]